MPHNFLHNFYILKKYFVGYMQRLWWKKIGKFCILWWQGIHRKIFQHRIRWLHPCPAQNSIKQVIVFYLLVLYHLGWVNYLRRIPRYRLKTFLISQSNAVIENQLLRRKSHFMALKWAWWYYFFQTFCNNLPIGVIHKPRAWTFEGDR